MRKPCNSSKTCTVIEQYESGSLCKICCSFGRGGVVEAHNLAANSRQSITSQHEHTCMGVSAAAGVPFLDFRFLPATSHSVRMLWHTSSRIGSTHPCYTLSMQHAIVGPALSQFCFPRRVYQTRSFCRHIDTPIRFYNVFYCNRSCHFIYIPLCGGSDGTSG